MKRLISKSLIDFLISRDRQFLMGIHPDQSINFDLILKDTNKYLELANLTNISSNFDQIHPTWNQFRTQIHQQILLSPQINFFAAPVIRETMVSASLRGCFFVDLDQQLKYIFKELGDTISVSLLHEDLIGCPLLLRPNMFNSSGGRVLHLYQLALALASYKKFGKSLQSVIEWGGGFGGLASLFKRLIPSLTYTIIDIPEVLCVQKLYLDAILGLNTCVFNNTDSVVPGKINLFSVVNPSLYENLISDLFVSAWALSESSLDSQLLVKSNQFFQASSILLAFQRPSNRHPYSLIPADIAKSIYSEIHAQKFLRTETILIAY